MSVSLLVSFNHSHSISLALWRTASPQNREKSFVITPFLEPCKVFRQVKRKEEKENRGRGKEEKNERVTKKLNGRKVWEGWGWAGWGPGGLGAWGPGGMGFSRVTEN